MNAPSMRLPTLLLVLLVSCKEPAPVHAPAPADTPGPTPAKAPAAGPLRAVMDLARDVYRAELWRDGLIIDMGSLDQHKYTLGAQLPGGFEVDKLEGVTLARLGQQASLKPPPLSVGFNTVVIRARSRRPNAKLMLSYGMAATAWTEVSAQWKELTFSLSRAPEQTDKMLALLQDNGAKAGTPPLEVDWIWIRKGAGLSPDLRRTSPATGPNLLAPRSTSYVYYLLIPAGAELRFAPTAAHPTHFKASLQVDGQKPRVLHQARVSGKGEGVRVSLARYAEEVVRLELTTTPVETGGGKPRPAAWRSPRIMAPAPAPAKVAPIPRAKHLIHIVLDAVRADVIRAVNPAARVATPAVSSLAAKGVTFTAAYTNATWTRPSAASYFSGRYPHDVISHTPDARLSSQVPLMADHLRAAGFQTAAFHANPQFLEPTGLVRGLEKIGYHLYASHKTAMGDASVLYPAAATWLRHERDPAKRLFLYIHTMDTHMPHSNRPPHTARLVPKGAPKPKGRLGMLAEPQLAEFMARDGGPTTTERDWAWAYYLGELAYHDSYLAWFIKELEGMGLLKDSLLVFSADHGELIMEHGNAEHAGPPYEGVVRVPLILRFPGGANGGARVVSPVEFVDLASTELEVLGLPPMKEMHGASLLPLIQGQQGMFPRTIIMSDSTHAIRLGPYKLFLNKPGVLLFDLRTDPGELTDLAPMRPIALRGCEVFLSEGLGTPTKAHRGRPYAKPAAAVPKPKIQATKDNQRQRALRSLGYINESP